MCSNEYAVASHVDSPYKNHPKIVWCPPPCPALLLSLLHRRECFYLCMVPPAPPQNKVVASPSFATAAIPWDHAASDSVKLAHTCRKCLTETWFADLNKKAEGFFLSSLLETAVLSRSVYKTKNQACSSNGPGLGFGLDQLFMKKDDLKVCLSQIEVGKKSVLY